MSLHDILQKPQHRAVMATICGEGGMGKTTLASLFPSPVFLRTEDGLESLGENAPMAFPVVGAHPSMTASQEIEDQLMMLGREEHSYKTAIIDSVTKLDILIAQEVIAADPKKPASINQANGGYGAGLAAVAERHRKIKAICDQLVQYKGMNIVFIAHADSETVELPDQDAYTRYTLRMNRRSVSHYSDDVDIVAFIKLKTFTSGDGDRKRATTTGERIITTYPTPNHISKNRYGIDRDLVFTQGANPLAEFVPALRGTNEVPTNQPTEQEVA